MYNVLFLINCSNFQITNGMKNLKGRLQILENEFTKLHTEVYNPLEKELDSIRNNFYNSFRPDFIWEPGIDIGGPPLFAGNVWELKSMSLFAKLIYPITG